ncbi:unnamed protein product [Darwinula stevensoni]|uniref:Uncharacterized protein n=1 Tax=Darwinula stevensoni TaxID=69355 RepID=A0A7R8WZF6_9CRUS|nr:unnamed protein product [Darwinula stevensoni]CAG0880504.1 unnamed protein product [Darwinula stevensoni]
MNSTCQRPTFLLRDGWVNLAIPETIWHLSQATVAHKMNLIWSTLIILKVLNLVQPQNEDMHNTMMSLNTYTEEASQEAHAALKRGEEGANDVPGRGTIAGIHIADFLFTNHFFEYPSSLLSSSILFHLDLVKNRPIQWHFTILHKYKKRENFRFSHPRLVLLQEQIHQILHHVIPSNSIHFGSALWTLVALCHPLGVAAPTEGMHARLDGDTLMHDLRADGASQIGQEIPREAARTRSTARARTGCQVVVHRSPPSSFLLLDAVPRARARLLPVGHIFG